MEQPQPPAAPPATPAPAAGDVDMHHRAFFSFEPTLLLADLGNIALDYCISGIHQLERAIHESPMFQQQQVDAGLAPNCPQVQQQVVAQLQHFKAAASEVLAEVQRRMAESVNKAAGNFERYEAATNLHVPPELYVQQPPVPVLAEAVDGQLEAQLDAELQQLREQVAQARDECQGLRQQLLHVTADVGKAAARAAAFKPLAEAVRASSQPLVDEAAAIGALSAKLQPMLARAQQLQHEWDGPVGSVLASAAGRRRGGLRVVGGGAEGQAAGSGGVQQHVRQLMAETGASLAALEQFNASLAGASK